VQQSKQTVVGRGRAAHGATGSRRQAERGAKWGGWVVLSLILVLAVTLGGCASGSGATLANLPIDEKEAYIVRVAAAYRQDGDLEKAQAQLAELEAPNMQQWIVDLSQRYIQ
jgi:hypothetical protein